ncbi:MAG: protein kinase domain-containing protein [Sinimarinibacterium flocculans]|uniref:protein kinase domain-containing protein n=1 Tax=Sinimarinibacterium flocculans TaxID=985250 RepID=UPI003C4529C2
MRGYRWRFGECALNGATLELSVRGRSVKLEPKPLQLLLFLLRHAGEVVTKDELLDGVWPGRVLSDTVLSKAMGRLRQGLDDEAQALIKTVHGYGYRLVAPVSIEALSPAAGPPPLLLQLGSRAPHRPGWSLSQFLGSGGFGEVWLGTHDQTRERRVFKYADDAAGLRALKREITLWRVLRATHGERPEFVRLLDWNVEEPPYFTESEYANAGPLPQWARARGGLEAIPVEQRLELVAQAAQALALAHAAGVLHKDLKPSNLLIEELPGGQPRLKLGDFGSGRVLDAGVLEQLDITRMGFTQSRQEGDSISGTPLYMAPELLADQQPTVQSDVYALGVILYQMVIADLRRPLAPGWEQGVADELLREDIASAAAGPVDQRLGDATALVRRLRTLDARREARTRLREAEAQRQALQQDMVRLRARQRLVLAAAAGLGVALITAAGAYVQVRQSRDRTEHALHEARIATAQTRAVNDFLVDDLLGQANPFTSGRSDSTVREVLDRAAATVGQRFADQPDRQAAVRLSLGHSYLGIGAYAAAQVQLQQVLSLQSPDARAQEALGVEARLALEQVYLSTDRMDEAEQVMAPLQASGDPDVRLKGEVSQAWLLHQRGAYETAATRLAALLPDVETRFRGQPYVSFVRERLATALRDAGQLDEAIAAARQALAEREAQFGADHPRALEAAYSLGGTLYLADRLDDALEVLDDVHARATSVLGEAHHLSLNAAADLGQVMQTRGDAASAMPLLEKVLRLRQAHYGDAHRDTRSAYNNLAFVYEDLQRGDEALALFEKTYALELEYSGPLDPLTLISGNNLARRYQKLGRWREAEPIQRTTLSNGRQTLPPDHWQLGIFMYLLADTLGELGQFEEADQLFTEAHPILRAGLGEDHQFTQRARSLHEALKQRAGHKS